ncbi:MAG: hypothetical protein Q8L48_35220 [Archangium sp.]|nr:hypothetical protein [Archangium sp.]
MSTDRAAQLVEAGIWLKLSGDREGARKLFERALKLDPGNEKAAQLLAGAPAPGEAEPPPPEAPPLPPAVPPGSNPFERPETSAPNQSEADWGMATGFRVPTPEPTLEGDWGRFTGARTPVPAHPPPKPAPAGDPGPYLASSSSNVVLGASPVPQVPKTTMQLFTPPKGELATNSELAPRGTKDAPAPKTTLQLFNQAPEPAPKTTLQLFDSEPAPEPAPARTTQQLFSPSPEPAPARTTQQLFNSTPSRTTQQLFGPPAEVPPAARTVELGGDAGPDVPPPSTPPLFGLEPPREPAGMSVTVGAPSRSAPPLFSSDSALNPLPSTPPLFATVPAEVAAPRTATDPMGYAWAWSSSSPPPRVPDLERAPEELTPVPRPSPSLAPRAESAWDQRSNPGIKLEAVVGQDRALDLISSDSKVTRSPDSRKEEIRTILRGARDLLDLDDHSGAMELIVKAQDIAPDDPDVLAMRERSEKTLLAMFESKLGKLETIPRVLLKDDEIIWLNLDHRAGFVLAQIDGTVSFDDLFSVSGMSRIDTARILAQLVEEGVISRG